GDDRIQIARLATQRALAEIAEVEPDGERQREQQDGHEKAEERASRSWASGKHGFHRRYPVTGFQGLRMPSRSQSPGPLRLLALVRLPMAGSAPHRVNNRLAGVAAGFHSCHTGA